MQTGNADDTKLRTYVVLAILLTIVAGGVIACASRDATEAGRSAEEIAALPALLPTDIHGGLDYSLDDVAANRLAPRLFIEAIEHDLARIRDVEMRKQTFFRILLPIVASENDRIREERQQIVDDPDAVDPDLYEKYMVETGDVDTLLRRVDVVPASLVLAQAAVESGWGSSRFAREGNNYFGMRTYSENVDGIDPKKAEGFKVIAYPSISASVRSYMLNLNTHKAYAELRRMRAQLRTAGEPLSGSALTGLLTSYSEVPERYGQTLRDLIKANNLDRFDGVRLSS
jgi:Bax protein